jgi:Metallo-beta-lactamase superfamily
MLRQLPIARNTLLRNRTQVTICIARIEPSMQKPPLNSSWPKRYLHLDPRGAGVQMNARCQQGRIQLDDSIDKRRNRNLSIRDNFSTAIRTFSRESQRGDERHALITGLDNDNQNDGSKLTPWLRQLWGGDGSSFSDSVKQPSHRKIISVESNMTDSETCETQKENDPKQSWLIDPLLRPHIRACLSDVEFESNELAARDTGLSVCTLGTGAGNATKMRSNTCTVVKNRGFSYLIDAGEGLQRQFTFSRINFRDVRKIFITHMHGDHVFGLPGLLLNMQVAGLNANKQRAVEIYGPVGLYNYIATALTLTNTELRRLNVQVFELQGGTQRSMRYAGNRKSFPEFHHKVSESAATRGCQIWSRTVLVSAHC